jgi:hypothetical protein
MFEDHEEGLAYIRQRRPICCRYECLSFARCEVVVLGTAGGVFRGINWALGCAVDGEQELVGSWSVANLGTVEYDVVFEDLSSAGFERARFVLSWEPEVLGSIRQLSSCGATVLPSVQHVLRGAENDANPRERRSLAEIGRLMQGADGMADAEALARDLADPAGPGGLAERLRRVLEAIQGLEPLLACSPRVRDLVLGCDARTQELQDGLDRAVRRHGAFGSEAEAMAFVERTLERDLVRSSRRTPLRRGALKVAPRLGTVRAATSAGA